MRQAEIDRGLARRHGHVRGVDDEHRAVERRRAAPRVDELGEIGQHVGHLVATFAAADIDDDIGVGVLGQRLLDHGLAGAEASGHGDDAAFGHREQEVEDPLPGDERPVVGQARRRGPRPAHGPALQQRQRAAVVELGQRFVDEPGARADGAQSPTPPGRHQHLVRQAALVDLADHVTRPDRGAHGERGLEFVAARAIECRQFHAGSHEVARGIGQPCQRAADAVEHRAQQPGPELGKERATGTAHRLAQRQPAGVLEDLQRRLIAGDAQHFALQLRLADLYQLVEPRTTHAAGLDKRTHDPGDAPAARRRPWGGHGNRTR